MRFFKLFSGIFLFIFLFPAQLFAVATQPIKIAGIPIEFILFGLTLLGIALFHKQTLIVALTGLASVLMLKIFSGFDLYHHLIGEYEVLVNLLGLLLGFAILAKHFEESKLPEKLPHYLPNDWKGGFVLLLLTFFISIFLDNIAAAMIGGMVAMHVFKNKVHIGYLAAIVAASNAGGAGSVVGDTTTTMMWIEGISPLTIIYAFTGSLVALLFFGIIASLQQDKYNRIVKDALPSITLDYGKLVIVGFILVGAIVTNILFGFPALGVWVVIAIGAFFKPTTWKEVSIALPGTIFLLSLVFMASLMPVDELPPASWQTTFLLGFVSSVFDNIPLTKLALTQGGFDWGILAYAVGFGGSMIWFGSSAGVALTNLYPESRSVYKWIKGGWHVIVAYIIGFFFMLSIVGWKASPSSLKNKKTTAAIKTPIISL